MTDYGQSRNDLNALLRDHGDLDGLARELGQHDQAAVLYEEANDNEPPKRVGLWRRVLIRLGFATAAIILTIPASHGDDSSQKVQGLYEACKKPQASMEFGVCAGYVSGVGEMMLAQAMIFKKSHAIEKMPALDNSIICGKTLTHGAMVQAFINWAEKNPQLWMDDQISGVMNALHDTWRCTAN